MNTSPNLAAANSVLSFLQNIDDADDARVFVRIALDALESAAEHTCQRITAAHRKAILNLICSADSRI